MPVYTEEVSTYTEYTNQNSIKNTPRRILVFWLVTELPVLNRYLFRSSSTLNPEAITAEDVQNMIGGDCIATPKDACEDFDWNNPESILRVVDNENNMCLVFLCGCTAYRPGYYSPPLTQK